MPDGTPDPREQARKQLERLGEFINERRKAADLTLRELASMTQVSNPYLSQIERGLHEPSVRVLKAIATALNVSAETLLVQAGLLEGAARARAADAGDVDRGDDRGRRAPHRRPTHRAPRGVPQLRRTERLTRGQTRSWQPSAPRSGFESCQ
jgi:transcriptional regulator with XRE-family HTH domain